MKTYLEVLYYIRGLITTSWVELIDKSEFAKAALDENSKIFMVSVIALTMMPIYPSRASQVKSPDDLTLAAL